MIRMPGALRDAGLTARMLLQVHDELVFEAPEAEAEAVIAWPARSWRRRTEPAVAISVPLVVEARAAANWDDAHFRWSESTKRAPSPEQYNLE
jgi:DNA polymerase-1